MYCGEIKKIVSLPEPDEVAEALKGRPVILERRPDDSEPVMVTVGLDDNIMARLDPEYEESEHDNSIIESSQPVTDKPRDGLMLFEREALKAKEVSKDPLNTTFPDDFPLTQVQDQVLADGGSTNHDDDKPDSATANHDIRDGEGESNQEPEVTSDGSGSSQSEKQSQESNSVQSSSDSVNNNNNCKDDETANSSNGNPEVKATTKAHAVSDSDHSDNEEVPSEPPSSDGEVELAEKEEATEKPEVVEQPKRGLALLGEQIKASRAAKLRNGTYIDVLNDEVRLEPRLVGGLEIDVKSQVASE